MADLTLNLPTTSIPASIAFFTSIGFDYRHDCRMLQEDSQTPPMLTWNQHIALVLHTHESWYKMQVTPMGGQYKPIHNAHTSASTGQVFKVASRQEVDRRCETAARNSGGRLDPTQPKESPESYVRTIEDPDGRVWALFAPQGRLAQQLAAPPAQAGAASTVRRKSRTNVAASGLKFATAAMSLAGAAGGGGGGA